nr:MAG: MC107L-like protein [Molluscum contagiosum virus]
MKFSGSRREAPRTRYGPDTRICVCATIPIETRAPAWTSRPSRARTDSCAPCAASACGCRYMMSSPAASCASPCTASIFLCSYRQVWSRANVTAAWTACSASSMCACCQTPGTLAAGTTSRRS